jgi:hypothetical protein
MSQGHYVRRGTDYGIPGCEPGREEGRMAGARLRDRTSGVGRQMDGPSTRRLSHLFTQNVSATRKAYRAAEDQPIQGWVASVRLGTARG